MLKNAFIIVIIIQHVETLHVDSHVRVAPVFCALYKQGGDTRETAWPLLWVQAVSSALLSDFHLADRHNICQGAYSQLKSVVRRSKKNKKHVL